MFKHLPWSGKEQQNGVCNSKHSSFHATGRGQHMETVGNEEQQVPKAEATLATCP